LYGNENTSISTIFGAHAGVETFDVFVLKGDEFVLTVDVFVLKGLLKRTHHTG
jgi:hypothetical protein